MSRFTPWAGCSANATASGMRRSRPAHLAPTTGAGHGFDRRRGTATMLGMSRRPRPIPSDALALERQVQLINRFPDQNPHPVLRMTEDGVLLYANRASREVTEALGVDVGSPLPQEWLGRLRAAITAADGATVEVESGWKTFAILPVPVPEFSFINLYGTDITAAK